MPGLGQIRRSSQFSFYHDVLAISDFGPICDVSDGAVDFSLALLDDCAVGGVT